jgi:adenosine kinase
MTILVTGSLAYDHIMDFPGYFKEHILPEKVHILNVSFLVGSLRKLRGGTASNIAYNLTLLEEQTAIMGTVGHDFQDYRVWLHEIGVDTHAIKVIPHEFTASCFITTDKSGNQITGFYPGAMAHAHELSLSDYNYRDWKVAIVSPNDPKAMLQHAEQCRAANIPFIFDPGQQSIALSGEDLKNGANGACLVVGNDYELEIFRTKTGMTPEDILEIAEMVAITKGEFGSTLLNRKESVDIPAVPALEVRDPTGAGDSYRAGIIKGLVAGYSLQETGQIASLASVYCVENYGTQNHRYTPAEFRHRYEENFGALPKPNQVSWLK